MEKEFIQGSILNSTISHIEDFDLKDQNVFIRADLNVPISQGKVTNSYRIMKALPTIRYALDQSARVILASHLGRPNGKNSQLSLSPVAEMLSELLDIDVFFVEELLSDVPAVISPLLKKNQLIFLENLRFHPGEQFNDFHLAQKISKNVDIYINDAFGVCHRKHMSLSALPLQIQKKGWGCLIQKEMEFLDCIKNNPKRPFTAILGGAKVKDKFDLILSLIDQVDTLVIGGAMAYVFLKAQGFSLGKTFVDMESLSLARELIQRAELRGKKLFLPKDHLIVPDLKKPHLSKTTSDENISEGFIGVDIGPKTVQHFESAFTTAQTIFWNGPMGMFEKTAYGQGTKKLAQAIGRQKAFCVVGGGDSARAVLQYGFDDQFDHVSTGGGAALAYIQGKYLPGIESLRMDKRES